MSRQPDTPSPETVRRSRLYWEQSQEDLKGAWKQWRGQSYLESSYLSLQAALNAMATVCTLHGHLRLPVFSPLKLAGLCETADARFAGLSGPCEALEAVQERGPYDEARDAEEEKSHARLCYDHSDRILKTVRGYLKENRRRYFAP